MGNAAGDVRPRGGALRGDEIADVIERYDAGAFVPSRIAGDSNVQNTLATFPKYGRLPLIEAQPKRTRLLPDRRNALLDVAERATDQSLVAPQQTLGASVR